MTDDITDFERITRAMPNHYGEAWSAEKKGVAVQLATPATLGEIRGDVWISFNRDLPPGRPKLIETKEATLLLTRGTQQDGTTQ